MTMNLSVFVFTLLCLISPHLELSATPVLARAVKGIRPQSDPSPACSRFANDIEVLRSFPFGVLSNPFLEEPSRTHAFWNADQTIRVLKIINEAYVPPTVFCLKSLEELRIENTNFSRETSNKNSTRPLPPAIRYLAGTLKILVIRNTDLTHISSEIGLLKKLIFLEVSHGILMSISEAIGGLPLLFHLYVRFNQLPSLPAALKNNRNLQHITVSNNPTLGSLDSLNGHSSLLTIDADNCSIERIPTDLPKLIKLSMANNNVTSIENFQTIGSTQPRGKQLNFANNRIQIMPWEIELVNHLSCLNVSGNHLDNLPDNIFKVTTLLTLDIRFNHFRSEHLALIVKKFNRTNPKLRLFW